MKILVTIITIAVASLLYSFTSATHNAVNGRQLFENKCARCHGKGGAKGMFGAKNLQRSTLSDEQYFNIISNGKKVMPSWKKKLSADEISDVITYIKTLKK